MATYRRKGYMMKTLKQEYQEFLNTLENVTEHEAAEMLENNFEDVNQATVIDHSYLGYAIIRVDSDLLDEFVFVDFEVNGGEE